jgi:hypothetical protein
MVITRKWVDTDTGESSEDVKILSAKQETRKGKEKEEMNRKQISEHWKEQQARGMVKIGTSYRFICDLTKEQQLQVESEQAIPKETKEEKDLREWVEMTKRMKIEIEEGKSRKSACQQIEGGAEYAHIVIEQEVEAKERIIEEGPGYAEILNIEMMQGVEDPAMFVEWGIEQELLKISRAENGKEELK